jgi:hypothetical protein
MSKIRMALAGIAVAAAAVAVVQAPAQAASAQPSAAGARAGTLARDGYLYLWWDSFSDPNGTDELCDKWAGSPRDLGKCNNQGSAAGNNGFSGALDDVKLHNYKNWAGAAYCLPNGVYADLDAVVFTQGAVSEGRGQTVNDQVESLHWVDHC